MSCQKIVAAFVLVLVAVPATWACNTPVCRYAMYNWPAAPYRVFYFHEGPQPKEDQEVNRLIADAAKGPAPLNVMLQPVDVAKKDRFTQLPEIVRKAWQDRPGGTKSIHAVFNSHGQRVFAGRLDPPAVKAMIESPARKRLAALLHDGNAGVLVLLASAKPELNQKAEQAIDELLRRVQAGEVAVATMDGPAMPKPADQADDNDKNHTPDDQPRSAGRPLKVARMTVSRTDPAEAWLVRSLMAVEDDLGPLADQPMVFAIYGRARAMPPFVGKGITADNLAEGVAFLAGACSCVVKDENPGVDLPVRWDWDATAEALAAAEQEDQAGGLGYRESPAPEPKKKSPPSKPAAKPEVAKTPSKTAKPPAAGKTETPAAKAPAADPQPPAYVQRQLRTSLAVIGFAAVVVFVFGLLWVRRSRAGNP